MNLSFLKKYGSLISIVSFDFATACFLSTNVFYFLNVGYDFESISIVGIVFTTALLFLEIPTGIVADKYGRKISVLVSAIVRSIAILMLYLSSSFTLVIVVMIMCALSEALSSGAITALYLSDKKKSEYNKHIRIISMATPVASILGGVLGALVYTLDPKSIWLCSSFMFLLSFILIAIFTAETTESEDDESLETPAGITLANIVKLLPAACFIPITILFFDELFFSGLSNFWQPIVAKHDEFFSIALAWSSISIASLIGAYFSKFVKEDVFTLVSFRH